MDKREIIERSVGAVAPKKKRKADKVAIVGCSHSKEFAPFDDPSFEIWGVNNAYGQFKRADRWFEIHEITREGDTFLRRGQKEFRGQTVNDYLDNLNDFLVKNDCPVYMQSEWDVLKTSVKYPLQDIINKYGTYFTNTISYEIALAIEEGFKEIHIYGVDMAVSQITANGIGDEYAHQRPSVEYFLGIAKGMGIKIYIPDEADLLKTRYLYGFDERKLVAWENKCLHMTKHMEQKVHKLNQEIEIATRKKEQFVGAILSAKELQKIWD